MSDPLTRDCPSIVTVDPFKCRVWELNDRVDEYVTEQSCRAEIESVKRCGQLVPVLGRPLHGSPDCQIEVICGARRLFVARHLRIPLRVEVRELTDQQAVIAIEAENSRRKQISPYERGLWLLKLIRERVYQSQDEMARKLHITPTQVTRLLKFSELPAIVIAAFPSPHEILECWAVELHKAWSDDRRRLLTDRARSLEARNPRLPAASVYEMLLSSRSQGARNVARRSYNVVKGPAGKPLLRYERQRNDVVLRIPNALVDTTTVREVTQAVVAVLTRQKFAETEPEATRVT